MAPETERTTWTLREVLVTNFDMAAFTAIVALIGAVIVAAAITSGLIERLRVPQVGLFLVLGAALGPYGLGVVNFELTSAALGAVATLGLILVLFIDAVSSRKSTRLNSSHVP